MSRPKLSLSSLLALPLLLVLGAGCDTKTGNLGSADDSDGGDDSTSSGEGSGEGGSDSSDGGGGGGEDEGSSGECGDESCGENEFCKLPAGVCGGTDGMCFEIPDACDLSYFPVCGCDGKTYGNECEADANGVNVDYQGECGAETCGDAVCGEEEFCQLPVGVCEGSDGMCAEIPEICTEEYAPVCGCDGKTYGNSCEAQANGVNVEHAGECGSAACGDEICGEEEFCQLPVGVCKGSDGMCAEIPEACTEEYSPVCGCDGKTYGNACEAQANGVNVESSGPCEADCLAIEDSSICDNTLGCAPKFMGSTFPLDAGDPDNNVVCPDDTVEFISCIPDQGCGDAETLFCKGERVWYSSDTCSPGPDFEDCTQDWVYGSEECPLAG